MNSLKKTFTLIPIFCLCFAFHSCQNMDSRNETMNENPEYEEDKAEMKAEIQEDINDAEEDIAELEKDLSENRENMPDEVIAEYVLLISDYKIHKNRLKQKKNDIDPVKNEEFEGFRRNFNTWWDETKFEMRELKVRTKDLFSDKDDLEDYEMDEGDNNGNM